MNPFSFRALKNTTAIGALFAISALTGCSHLKTFPVPQGLIGMSDETITKGLTENSATLYCARNPKNPKEPLRNEDGEILYEGVVVPYENKDGDPAYHYVPFSAPTTVHQLHDREFAGVTFNTLDNARKWREEQDAKIKQLVAGLYPPPKVGPTLEALNDLKNKPSPTPAPTAVALNVPGLTNATAYSPATTATQEQARAILSKLSKFSDFKRFKHPAPQP